jgi:glutathione S-transferase
MDSLAEDAGAGPLAAAALSRFRCEFHASLTARKDEIFELADAVLCAGGPVRSLAGLSLVPEHRRGHTKLPNLKRLVDEISARPAAQRAVALASKHKFKTEMDEEARNALFRHMTVKVA